MKINRNKLLLVLMGLGSGIVTSSCSRLPCPSSESILLRTTRASFLGSEPMYAVDSEGGGEIQCELPRILGDNPDWSTDGNWIAYDTSWIEHPNDSQIYIVPVTGGKTIQVTDRETGASDASWSSDGKSIAYEGDGIQIVDIDCFIHNVACNSPAFSIADGLKPDWSSDKVHIVYQWYSQQENRSYDIKVLDINNPSQIVDVTPPGTRGCSNPKWSPDGTKIAVSCLTENLHDIFVIDWETFQTVNLTKSRGVIDVMPIWSPDGSRIAFESDRGDGLGKCLNAECTVASRGLYVMNNDGANLTRITFRNDEDILWASWIP